jgi:Spy/CpxP family protein refolding chaperone
MKFPIKTTLVAAGVALTLSVPQWAFANAEQRQGLRGLLEQLSLTEDQKDAVADLLPMRLGGKTQSPVRQFAPVIFTDELDTQQLELLVDASIATKKAKGLYATTNKHELLQILTDEQETQLEELLVARADEREERERPDFKAKLIENLDITDEQLEEMDPLFDTNEALREAMKTQRQGFKDFTRALIEQDEFDDNAWLAQFDAEALLMRETVLALTTNMHNIYALLTEEQQDELKRKMRQASRKARRARSENQRRG